MFYKNKVLFKKVSFNVNKMAATFDFIVIHKSFVSIPMNLDLLNIIYTCLVISFFTLFQDLRRVSVKLLVTLLFYNCVYREYKQRKLDICDL
jgi:hypothetical protein